MAQTVLITLTTAGADTGPFDLYSDADLYTTPFEVGISKAALVAGYTSVTVPDAATSIRVKSTLACLNYADLSIETTTTTTTSTTTVAPGAMMYVYFTNSNTTSNEGSKIWFSLNDYYTPNTPGSLIAANCLTTAELGASPIFTLDVSYWRKDVYNTLDDGFGSLRPPDGSATIDIVADSLVYDGLTGAWTIDTGKFTSDQGTNIAAFRIDMASPTVVGTSITYGTVIPVPVIFVRNDVGMASAFAAGSTGITFFQL